MYIEENASIPAAPVIGLDVTNLFECLKKKYDIINLPYTFSSNGVVTINPATARKVGVNSGFSMVYIPSGNTKGLWTITKAITLPVSVFYGFNIDVSSLSDVRNFSYSLTIANVFTPIYNISATVTWANSGDHQFAGITISTWTALGDFTWNDLVTSSFENAYDNLPTISQTVTCQISADTNGNLSDTISYTIVSGQIGYTVQFDVSGTPAEMVLSNAVIKIGALFTADQEANTSNFVASINPLSGTLNGVVSSYNVILWNTMDTLLAVNMQDPSDILTIYNNGTSAISAYIVTANSD